MKEKMAIDVQGVTDVRKHFSEFVDAVVHKKPQFVIRNDRDVFMAINLDHLKPLVSGITFNVELEVDEEGSFIASAEKFWNVVSEPAEDMALNSLAHEIKEFAHDYMQDFDLYYKTPNFSEEFPFMLKAYLSDIDKLKESFNVKHVRP